MCKAILEFFSNPLNKAPYPKEKTSDPLYSSASELRHAFYNLYEVEDPDWITTNVNIIINPNYNGASESCYDVITVNPGYARPGVLAHEVCHSIYSRLTTEQKERFKELLSAIVPANRIMELAIRDYNDAQYWTSVPAWEAHAQLFRFFGRKMPTALYEFYPHLI